MHPPFIELGNPVIMPGEVERMQRVMETADATGVIQHVRMLVDKLVIECKDVTKTYHYPKGVTLRWVLQKITETSKQVNSHYKRADASSQRFVTLCEDILKEGGDVSIENGTVIYTRGTFRASHPVVAITASCVDEIKRIIEKEYEKRAEQAEIERLRRLAREHGCKV